jgi:hypothetical protein
MSAATIFSVLGPLFLLLGFWRAIHDGMTHPQARTWLIVGAIFSAVAAWLRCSAP